MIHSMTAYAKTEKTLGRICISTEIRSYNSKNLDLMVRLPHGYEALEDPVRTHVSASITRGRVEIRFCIQDEMDETIAFAVDQAKAKAYCEALAGLKSSLGLTGDIQLDHLIACSGLFKPTESEKDLDAIWPIMKTGLDEALYSLTEMRKKEGAFIYKDFIDRLQEIETSVENIARSAESLLPIYQERLKERINALTQGVIEIDPGRIAQEAAFLADRSDISEELVRTGSHLTQFRHIMNGPEPAGRKLNFLLQELNREFNTMGAKSGSAEISHTIVTLKSELEKIREQVQNIE